MEGVQIISWGPDGTWGRRGQNPEEAMETSRVHPRGETGALRQAWGLWWAERCRSGVEDMADLDHSASLMMDSEHFVSGEGPCLWPGLRAALVWGGQPSPFCLCFHTERPYRSVYSDPSQAPARDGLGLQGSYPLGQWLLDDFFFFLLQMSNLASHSHFNTCDLCQ